MHAKSLKASEVQWAQQESQSDSSRTFEHFSQFYLP